MGDLAKFIFDPLSYFPSDPYTLYFNSQMPSALKPPARFSSKTSSRNKSQLPVQKRYKWLIIYLFDMRGFLLHSREPEVIWTSDQEAKVIILIVTFESWNLYSVLPFYCGDYNNNLWGYFY